MTDIDEARKRLHHQADLADKQLASWGTVTNRISDIRAVLDALDAAERARDEFRAAWNAQGFEIIRLEDQRDEALAVIADIRREVNDHTQSDNDALVAIEHRLSRIPEHPKED